MLKMIGRTLLIAVLICGLVGPQPFAMAEDRPLEMAEHLVGSADLEKAIQESSKQREETLTQVDQFFSLDAVNETLQTANIDGSGIRKAIPLLSDSELEELASRTRPLNENIAAGTLSNRELTYVVIGLAFLILIIAIAD